MSHRTRLLLPFLLLPLTSACSFGFEASSEVIDLRILAIRAEPPEFVVGSAQPGTVTVSALVVDPRTPTRVVPFEWRACVPGFSTGAASTPGGPPEIPSGGGVDATADPRCDDTDDANRVGSGTGALGDVSVTVPVPESLADAVQGAAAKGLALSLYVNAQLTIDDNGRLVQALKRVAVSPSVPEGRTPNRNPHLESLLFDGEVWDPATPLRLTHGDCTPDNQRTAIDRTRPGEEVRVCTHTITPVFTADEPETFVVRTFDGRDLEQKERLRFSWFVEHGSLSFGETEEWNGIGPKRYDPLSTEWNEPPEKPEGSNAIFWVVVRDGRGGVSWERRELVFE